MGSKERRERERRELRDKILDASRDLFAEEGYDKVSMRQIAERIEYSPTAIYLHFPDKETLFRELCRQDFGRLSEKMARLAQVEDPLDRIEKLGEAYVAFALGYPNHYRMMFMTVHPVPKLTEEERRQVENPDENAYAFLRLTCAEAIDAGRVREDLRDPDLLAQLLWAGVHGLAALHITKGHESWVAMRPPRAATRALVGALRRGIEAPRAKPPARSRKE